MEAQVKSIKTPKKASNEKREKFVQLAQSRTVNAIKAIRVIGKLGNKSHYEYDEKDVKKIVSALTKEIDAPSKGHLDRYLQEFMRGPIALEQLATQIIKAPGLDGRAPAHDENEIVGNIDAPEVKAQYRAMALKRAKRD